MSQDVRDERVIIETPCNLPRLIGAARAFEITSGPTDSAEAERSGLVSQLVAADAQMPAALRIAEVIL